MLERASRAPVDRADRTEALLARLEVDEFNARYCSALDEMRLADWAEMFAPDGFYVVVSRENVERDRPVGLIYCEGQGMIRDRAFALEKTSMFAPRYLRHFITNLHVNLAGADEIHARANYLVMQVLFDRPDGTVHQVGRYEDVLVRTGDGLKLKSRRCIYDSLLVPNALCLPV